MTQNSTWRESRPADAAWRGTKGRSAKAGSVEQDRAAGGHERRLVDAGDGRVAHASVELKLLPKQRRIRAYLRWSRAGKTHTTYLGEVDRPTRAENLRAAWDTARAKELLVEPDASWASSPASRAVMKANKPRDTMPELAVRSALFGMGLRYRVGTRPLPSLRRTADVVFPRERVAVFVDGCFWHGCPDHHRPATGQTSAFWSEKISANRARDADTNRQLIDEGWVVIRGWEHEPAQVVAARIREAVLQRRER
ncbi:very short patch repair endonuclease [Isoptericola sp. S6320L]|uniref:very short patch repair endonuclease n=1 Tax=Isoptericola sp. S6320L TaxID=2926411 RepID=UPI001FF33B2D|nr:very short patch repair endonuclease [Isoptericola sp. S6320L]MCK0116969.1 very short patch repair endonuclease [Isoptericola sp. S6320L]